MPKILLNDYDSSVLSRLLEKINCLLLLHE